MGGNLYKIEDGVYFDAIGNGSIGMMYHRDLEFSAIATFTDPEIELAEYEVVTDPIDKRLIQSEIINIEVMTNMRNAL